MKAIRLHAYGGPEALRHEDLPDPVPGPGQVVMRVEAAGVNFIDTYHRRGLYQVELPITLGQEAAGIVESLGPGVEEFHAGDRVASYGVLGGYAQRLAVPAYRLVPVPKGMDSKLAAAVMLQGMTAHYLACSTYPLKKGDTCLIHAAAGGVGLLLCQIAKRRGARVIGTTSTAEKAALARDAGADEVILYSERDFADDVWRLTDGRGVEVIYDGVGQTTFEKGLGCIAPRGMMVLFGQSSGPVPPLDPQILNQRGSLYLTRPTLAHYVATHTELRERAAEVMSWVQMGTLRARIGAEFPLAAAADAHRRLESRGTTGKLLLIPG
jgi:NADPH:quinone reductase